MKIKIIISGIILFLVIGLTYGDTQISHLFLYRNLITKYNVHLMPTSRDFRNYFIFQSIRDTTKIIIGEFTAEESKISVITEKENSGDIKSVVEYFPDKNEYINDKKSSSSFFTNINDMKKQIIEGTVFKHNYAYKMRSLDLLKDKIDKGENITKTDYGYKIIVYDPDNPSEILCDFYFSKFNGEYDLVFTTYYYILFNTKIVPPVLVSVCCRASKDPVVIDYVDRLFKMVEARKAKKDNRSF